jgi:hypothetical protein
MPDPALRHATDECELIESARRNDREAIRLPIKQQNRRLYRIARSIVRSIPRTSFRMPMSAPSPPSTDFEARQAFAAVAPLSKSASFRTILS